MPASFAEVLLRGDLKRNQSWTMTMERELFETYFALTAMELKERSSTLPVEPKTEKPKFNGSKVSLNIIDDMSEINMDSFTLPTELRTKSASPGTSEQEN